MHEWYAACGFLDWIWHNNSHLLCSAEGLQLLRLAPTGRMAAGSCSPLTSMAALSACSAARLLGSCLRLRKVRLHHALMCACHGQCACFLRRAILLRHGGHCKTLHALVYQ